MMKDDQVRIVKQMIDRDLIMKEVRLMVEKMISDSQDKTLKHVDQMLNKSFSGLTDVLLKTSSSSSSHLSTASLTKANIELMISESNQKLLFEMQRMVVTKSSSAAMK